MSLIITAMNDDTEPSWFKIIGAVAVGILIDGIVLAFKGAAMVFGGILVWRVML